MKRNKLVIAGSIAMILFVVDMALLIYVGSQRSIEIGWGKILGAVAIQLFIVGLLATGWSMRRDGASSDVDSEFAYRNQIPITIIGFVLVTLSLSLGLLYIGVVCPEHSIPTTRGMSMCS